MSIQYFTQKYSVQFKLICTMILLVIGASLAAAEPRSTSAECRPNKCGPGGWLGTVVPNEIGSCQFGKACNIHDACYTRCAECGDLYQTKFCRLPKDEREPHRKQCDVAFYSNLIRANRGIVCQLAAGAYYLTVRSFGSNFYRRLGITTPRERFQQKFLEELKRLKSESDPASIIGRNLVHDITNSQN